MNRLVVASILATTLSTSAYAQTSFGNYPGTAAPFNNSFDSITPTGGGAVDPGRDYIITNRVGQDPRGPEFNPNPRGDALYQYGVVSISSFASAADLQRNSAGLAAIAQRLDRAIDRFSEGIALAGAINVLPPNAGDRFAVSFGGAGYGGQGAGSVAVSARFGDNGLAYVGYAQGASQALVKGGVGWSFR